MLSAWIALGEAAVGLLLLVYPPLIGRLLFGATIDGTGVVVARVAGIALIAFGVACWPASAPTRVCRGIVTYNVMISLYLASLGIRGDHVGILLWPTVALHALLTLLVVRAQRAERRRALP